MKYQFNVLKKLIKMDFFKLICVFITLFAFNLIVIFFSYGESTIIDFNTMIGILDVKDFNLMGLLWFLFQVFFVIYMSYRYYFYENDNSSEFILLRIKFKKFVNEKLIVMSLFVILFRLLYYLLVYIIFLNSSFFNLFVFFENIYLYLIISLGVFILFIFKYLFLFRNDSSV